MAKKSERLSSFKGYMKRSIIILSFTILAVIISDYIKEIHTDQKISFLPISYENVDTVSQIYHTVKIYSPAEIKQIVKAVNGIKSYVRTNQPVDHPHPGPIRGLKIKLKDNNYIDIYENDDGIDKISDMSNSYMIEYYIADPF